MSKQAIVSAQTAEALLPVVRQYEAKCGDLPMISQLMQMTGFSKSRINEALRCNPELGRLRIENRLAELNARESVVWFTLEMAAEYLATSEIRFTKSGVAGLCERGELAFAKRWGLRMVSQAELDRFAAGYEERLTQIRQRQRDGCRQYRQHLRPTCRRCEIAENVGADGLCPQCREELTGRYQWYPLPSRVVAAEYEYRPAI